MNGSGRRQRRAQCMVQTARQDGEGCEARGRETWSGLGMGNVCGALARCVNGSFNIRTRQGCVNGSFNIRTAERDKVGASKWDTVHGQTRERILGYPAHARDNPAACTLLGG
eukprot:168208-Prymnesium_polylepis.1